MSAPLVSILIPAYNERFFGEALASARAQTLAETEIVVSDDSPGDGIGRIVASQADPRVRYSRNVPALGFAANFTRCFALARGRYVKFLNDDDRLHPRCLEALVAVMEGNASVALATSRRTVIDEAGRAAADVPATTPVSHVSALMSGIELGDFCLVNGMNLIGEPTTALFRREELAPEAPSIFRWAGRDYHCLADLSLWLRLLVRGAAYYGAAPLSEYRRHAGQEQRRAELQVACLLERAWILEPARRCGFLRTPELRAAAVRAVRAMGATFHASAASHVAARDALAATDAALHAFEASNP